MGARERLRIAAARGADAVSEKPYAAEDLIAALKRFHLRPVTAAHWR